MCDSQLLDVWSVYDWIFIDFFIHLPANMNDNYT